MGWEPALGLTAGLLSLIDPLPYVRDVLRGTTRPHRGTWCVWSLLGVVAFVSQWGSGGGWSLLMVGVQALSMSLVFVLSLRRGVGGVARIDPALIGLALIGVVGWQVSDEPLVAVICVVVADAAGVVMMLPKTWRDLGRRPCPPSCWPRPQAPWRRRPRAGWSLPSSSIPPTSPPSTPPPPR